MAIPQMEARRRFSHSEKSECSAVTHIPSYPSESETLKRQQALQTATYLSGPAVLTTLAYLIYRIWCGLSHAVHSDTTRHLLVGWMFLGVEIGFLRKPSLF